MTKRIVKYVSKCFRKQTTLVLNKINLSFIRTFGSVNNTVLRRIRLNHFNGYINSFSTKVVYRVVQCTLRINTPMLVGDNTKKNVWFKTVIFKTPKTERRNRTPKKKFGTNFYRYWRFRWSKIIPKVLLKLHPLLVAK